MTGLSTHDLTRMRAIQDEQLTSTCTVRRLAFAADGAGGQTETATDTANVKCRMQPVTNIDERRAMFERYGTEDGWRLTVAHDTDLIPGDRIVYSSNTYEVKDVDSGHSWMTARRARCTRVI